MDNVKNQKRIRDELQKHLDTVERAAILSAMLKDSEEPEYKVPPLEDLPGFDEYHTEQVKLLLDKLISTSAMLDTDFF